MQTNQDAYRRNIPLLFAITFFQHFIFAYVIERLFALERGMTVLYVVYTEMLYALAVAALEIPSGVLADRFGRKPLLLVGALSGVLEFGILIFAEGFWLFGLSALTAAVGGACMSGAWNALLFDTMTARGRADAFERTLGRLSVTRNAAALIGGFGGAAIAEQFGLTTPYWISAGCCAAALLLTLFLKEPTATAREHEAGPTPREIVRTAVRFFRTHADMRRMALHAAFVGACYVYMDEFWQIQFMKTGFPLALFGVVMAANVAVQMPGALVSAKLLKRLSHRAVIRLSFGCAALGLLLAAATGGIPGLVGLCLANFAISVMEPARDGALHRSAAPEARATIESAMSLCQRALTFAVGIAFGALSGDGTVFSGYWLLFGLTLAAAVTYAFPARMDKNFAKTKGDFS